MSERYYSWIAEVCKLMGWPIEKGDGIVQDVSWWGCYDDGMTPEAAVNEYKANLDEHGVLGTT